MKSLQLSWVKCMSADLMSNHTIPFKVNIPPFYWYIHNVFMVYFKWEPINLLYILIQLLWYNNWIKVGSGYLFNRILENMAISKIEWHHGWKLWIIGSLKNKNKIQCQNVIFTPFRYHCLYSKIFNKKT